MLRDITLQRCGVRLLLASEMCSLIRQVSAYDHQTDGECELKDLSSERVSDFVTQWDAPPYLLRVARPPGWGVGGGGGWRTETETGV